ncbi:uncharacterized protein SPAPADRAFT_52511 [Spathaspora passalidarum NRRL Y-27907]|uniref:LIM zinc-binding domain-containing protein n=1 Tax=Spathaspora passalidarum (strain NRRL Y-27907 / 11-Y1) TaxID=619300 RepID=G3AU49_SPAPN|nr:uncharacterized protein SPAPADRAFT_52511 [Spathaspora passalidarum NRRL Y-27907]EGW30425.1 hypothetical protein SPAPADRAFT_52511 [Spathaspora passalidarum NRRL Y-27907]
MTSHGQSPQKSQQHSSTGKQNNHPQGYHKSFASSSGSSLSSHKSSSPFSSSTFSKMNYNKSTSSTSTNTPIRPSNEYMYYQSQPELKSSTYRSVSETYHNRGSADQLSQQPHHLHLPYQQQSQHQQRNPSKQSHAEFDEKRVPSAPLHDYAEHQEISYARSASLPTNPYNSHNNASYSQHQQYQQPYQKPIKEESEQDLVKSNYSSSPNKNVKNLKLNLHDQSNYHPVTQSHQSQEALQNPYQTNSTAHTQTKPAVSSPLSPNEFQQQRPPAKTPGSSATKISSPMTPNSQYTAGFRSTSSSMAFAGYHHPPVHHVGSPRLTPTQTKIHAVPGLPSSPSHPELQGVSRDIKLKNALEDLHTDNPRSTTPQSYDDKDDGYFNQVHHQQQQRSHNPYARTRESDESSGVPAREFSAQETSSSSLSTTIPTDYSYHEPGASVTNVPSLYSFEQGSSGYSQDERSSLSRTIHQFEHTAQASPSYTFVKGEALSPTNNYEGSPSSSHYLRQLNPDSSSGVRMSQLSMVSSIISNDLVYQSNVNQSEDDDDRNEEEDEIDRELERQLASLKMGSANVYAPASVKRKPPVPEVRVDLIHSPERKPPIPEVRVDLVQSPERKPPIPEVRIELADSPEVVQEPQFQSQFNTEVAKHELPEEEDLDDDLNSIESTPPLSLSHSSKHSSNDKTYVEPDPPIKIPELDDAVPPLQPKTHSIEEELKNMNFEIKSTNESPSMYINQTNVADNVTGPTDISPYTPASTSSSINPAPAGTGPCRGCFFEIDPHAKGSNKAIFSTMGELSGQWHRKCFKCSFLNCDLHFTKHIPCYVLNDNPYCNQHYHMLNHTMCENCMEGIEGEAIQNETGQMWHLDCLRCTVCRDVINNDYYLIDGVIVCEADVGKVTKHGNNSIEKRKTRIFHV